MGSFWGSIGVHLDAFGTLGRHVDTLSELRSDTGVTQARLGCAWMVETWPNKGGGDPPGGGKLCPTPPPRPSPDPVETVEEYKKTERERK